MLVPWEEGVGELILSAPCVFFSIFRVGLNMRGIRVREAELAGELGGCLGCIGEPFGKGS